VTLQGGEVYEHLYVSARIYTKDLAVIRFDYIEMPLVNQHAEQRSIGLKITRNMKWAGVRQQEFGEIGYILPRALLKIGANDPGRSIRVSVRATTAPDQHVKIAAEKGHVGSSLGIS
jgi:hypothetical protein